MKLKLVRRIWLGGMIAAGVLFVLGCVMELAVYVQIAFGVYFVDTGFYLRFWRCPHCGKSLGRLAKVNYCSYCGEELDM